MKSANGVTGILLVNGSSVIFRVYDKTEKSKFEDYDLAHSDLQVTINDSDAFFYKTSRRLILDHSPATLGIKK